MYAPRSRHHRSSPLLCLVLLLLSAGVLIWIPSGCGDRSLPSDAGFQGPLPVNPETNLGGPDSIPPGDVLDLHDVDVAPDCVTLSWTAPGDDGQLGIAWMYDVRYSTAPITAADFHSATPVEGAPAPGLAGQTEILPVFGLLPDQTYYFALKTADEAFNWSELSNVCVVTTCVMPCPPCTCADHKLHPGFWIDYDNVGRAPAGAGKVTVTLKFRVRTLLTCNSGEGACTGDVAWAASSSWMGAGGVAGPPVGEPSGKTGEDAVSTACGTTRNDWTPAAPGWFTYQATVADPDGDSNVQGTITLTVSTFCVDAETDSRTVEIVVDTGLGGDRINHDESDLDGDGGKGRQEKGWRTNERKWSTKEKPEEPDHDPKARARRDRNRRPEQK